MRLNKKTPLPGGDDGYLRPVDSRDVKGVYSNFPAYTPKYLSTNGRDYVRELTVARLYLSGGAYETLPGVAPWFSVNSYVGFFLQEVTERNAEKSQIVPMNGDGYAAFFSGREPRVYSFSGVVLNTQQDQWRSTLTNLYEEVFRGSKVSGMNRVVQIAYDDKVVSGSMMNMTQVIASAPDETFAKFAFDILVVAVYDAWMESDDDFTSAGSAFLGDKTIFPDMARSETKKTLRDYVKSQYIAPPPAVRKKSTGTACAIKQLTVNAAGLQENSETAFVTNLPKGCSGDKVASALLAEANALEKKIADNKAPAGSQEKLQSLHRTLNALSSIKQQAESIKEFTAQEGVYNNALAEASERVASSDFGRSVLTGTPEENVETIKVIVSTAPKENLVKYGVTPEIAAVIKKGLPPRPVTTAYEKKSETSEVTSPSGGVPAEKKPVED